MQADIEHLQTVMERDQYRFQVKEVGGGLQKEDRIRRLIPIFQHGQVYFPQQYHYTRRNGKTVDLVREFVEEELLAFPVSRHDDMLDSLARLMEPGRENELRWPQKQRQVTYVDPHRSGVRGMGLMG
jgi:phage terminase large subunit-like protein